MYKKSLRGISAGFLTALLLSCSLIAIAYPTFSVRAAIGDNTGTPNPAPNTGTPNPAPNTGIPTPSDPCQTGQICNPLLNISSLCQLLNAIINIVIQLGSIIGVLFIIWSGFLFVEARGNEAKLKDAKATMFTTIVGLAILLGSSVIAKIILNTISKIINTGGSC